MYIEEFIQVTHLTMTISFKGYQDPHYILEYCISTCE